jgi:hypothetical protein
LTSPEAIGYVGGVRQAAEHPVRAIVLAFCIAAALATCSVLLTQQAAASSTHLSSRCTTFRADGTKYGVYIADGRVKCAVATSILQAIAEGKGKEVDNGASANSYVTYGGWLCPFATMGEQTCEHSQHPVGRPSQDIASLSCKFGAGCPARAAFEND